MTGRRALCRDKKMAGREIEFKDILPLESKIHMCQSLELRKPRADSQSIPRMALFSGVTGHMSGRPLRHLQQVQCSATSIIAVAPPGDEGGTEATNQTKRLFI